MPLMGKYDHSFNDLHTADSVTGTEVDLQGNGDRQDATGAVIINDAPGNPDKGKADQFGDIERVERPGDIDQEQEFEISTDEEQVQEDGEPVKGKDRFEERLGRETRMREEAEERSRRLEAQLGQLSSKIDLQQQERDTSELNATDQRKLEELKAQKIKAREEGETATEVDLDDKITDVKAGIQSRKAQLDAAKEQLKKAASQPAVKPANPKAQAWIAAHPAYGTDPLFKEAALAADQLLYKMGYNQNSDEYYTELSKTLAKRFSKEVNPEYLKSRRGGKPGQGGVGSSGTRGGNSMQRTNVNPNKVTITPSEIQMLQQMGQDTSNPAVLREFARNKRADLRATAERS